MISKIIRLNLIAALVSILSPCSEAKRAIRELSYAGFAPMGPGELIGAVSSNSQQVLYGSNVAMSRDGTRLAVGAPQHDYLTPMKTPLVADNAGAIFIYIFYPDTGNWNYLWFLAGNAGEKIGNFFSISANASRIAMRRYNPTTVQVSDITTGQLGLRIDPTISCQTQGQAITISADGNRVAVSCENVQSTTEPGLVEIFEWTGGEDWVSTGVIRGTSIGDAFGWATSLSADGNRIAIGAPYHYAGSLGECGLVRVFDYNGTNWNQIGSDILGSASAEQLGMSLDFSEDGRVLAVGSPGACENGYIFNGKVQIFQQAADEWIPSGNAVYGGASGERFGISVRLSENGNRYAAMSPAQSTTSGQLRVFYQEADDTWTQYGDTIEGTGVEGFGVGRNVLALSGDGTRLATGEPLFNKVGRVEAWDASGIPNVTMAPTLSPTSISKSQVPVSKIPSTATGVCYLTFGEDSGHRRNLEATLSGSRLILATGDTGDRFEIELDVEKSSAVLSTTLRGALIVFAAVIAFL